MKIRMLKKAKPVSRQRRWQKQQKELGLCIRCSKEAINENYCAEHNEQAKQNRMAYYYRKQAA